MSTLDTMTPLISAPWVDDTGGPLGIRSLPGLHPATVREIEHSYPGALSPAFRELLTTCCGLAGTALGRIDFTGCWFPEEPCEVLRPSLALARDEGDRRWLAEAHGTALPGPVWCVFSQPEVAVYVCDDLATFISTLRERTCHGHLSSWLQNLDAQARTVWAHRRALAKRPHQAPKSDEAIRGWLATLPSDAYVYDLRTPMAARGWPYGLAGPDGRLYRCGRLPVFAVAGLPTEGWREKGPEVLPVPRSGPRSGVEIDRIATRSHRRSPGFEPVRPPLQRPMLQRCA
jgi:hypothetical protein